MNSYGTNQCGTKAPQAEQQLSPKIERPIPVKLDEIEKYLMEAHSYANMLENAVGRGPGPVTSKDVIAALDGSTLSGRLSVFVEGAAALSHRLRELANRVG